MPTLSSPTNSDRRLRIFMCHAIEDKEAVRNLYRRLQGDGFKPWLDEEDLLPGQKWQREISSAIKSCDVVIVCLSKRSANKEGYIQREIREARERADEMPEGTIYMIPIRLEPVEVPESLRKWHWANLFEEEGYRRLVQALRERAESIGVDFVKPFNPEVVAVEEAKKNREPDGPPTIVDPGQPSGMYLYHADALALGGSLSRPVRMDIPSQAAISLPTSGGMGSARVSALNFNEIISFHSAYATVTGGQEMVGQKIVRIISSSVVVEGLNILNVITADKIVARLISRSNGDPSFATIGSHFENLKISGQPVDVESDHRVFGNFDTRKRLDQGFRNEYLRGQILDGLVGSKVTLDEKSSSDLREMYKIWESQKEKKKLDSEVRGSFVRKVGGLDSIRGQAYGSVIEVPGFGLVCLGELIISHSSKRLIMARIILNSKYSGAFVVCCASADGTFFP